MRFSQRAISRSSAHALRPAVAPVARSAVMKAFLFSTTHHNSNHNSKNVHPGGHRTSAEHEPFADPREAKEDTRSQETAEEQVEREEETLTKDEEEQQQQEEEEEDLRDGKIRELEDSLKACQEKLLLSYADRENIRKIAKDDVNRATMFGMTDFAKGVIEVADNLERALAATDKTVGLEPMKHHSEEAIHAAFGDNHLARELYIGVRMTEVEMMKFLSKNHVSRRYPLGEKFDADHMEALVAIPDPSKEPGTVAFVQRPGYLLHHRVLRAAEVGVVKKTSE